MIGEDVCKKLTKEWTEMEEEFRHPKTHLAAYLATVPR